MTDEVIEDYSTNQDIDIIRNKGKVKSIITNAKYEPQNDLKILQLLIVVQCHAEYYIRIFIRYKAIKQKCLKIIKHFLQHIKKVIFAFVYFFAFIDFKDVNRMLQNHIFNKYLIYNYIKYNKN